jgi:hypothetical protein
VRTFVNATMYPQHNNKKIKEKKMVQAERKIKKTVQAEVAERDTRQPRRSIAFSEIPRTGSSHVSCRHSCV